MELYIKGFLIACKGVPITMGVTVSAVFIGALLGFVLAIMKLSKNKILSFISTVYVDVIRGTPLIVQALILAFGVPQLLMSKGIEFTWGEYLVIPAIIVCGMNSAAYVAEVIRSGIQAVDYGQREAAYSLGMSRTLTMKLIVIPQTVRIILPALGNELITLIKETAVLSYVGVVEILRRGTLWNAASFETFPAYIGVALVYLCLTMGLSRAVAYMERRLSISDRGK